MDEPLVLQGRSELTPYVAGLIAREKAASEEQLLLDRRSQRLKEDPRFPQFNSWLAIEPARIRICSDKNGKTTKKLVMWLCECQCKLKTRKEVNQNSLIGEHSKSCGYCTRSKNTTHGHASPKNRTAEYHIWGNIRNRANNEEILFHEPWHDYSKFIADVGRRPSENHVLCRAKLKKGFVPKNLKWRRKRLGKFEYKDQRQSVAVLARKHNLKPNTLRARLKKGDDVVSAVEARPQAKNIFMTYQGKTQSLSNWSKEYGISNGIVRKRYYMGWSPERILTVPAKEQLSEIVITFEDKTHTISEWSKIIGMPYMTIYGRFMKGDPPEKILSTQFFNLPLTYLTYQGKTQTIPEWSKETGIDQTTLRRRHKQGWSDELCLSTPVQKKRR